MGTGAITIFDLPVTLTFYSIAAGMSLSLCMVLAVFARFQPDTKLVGYWIRASLLLSCGFFVSGFASDLPLWSIVVLTNVLLLAAGPILYSGFSAYCKDSDNHRETFGWGIVVFTIPAFWYWGLVDANGQFRSMVFSFAAAAINGRTALLLVRFCLKEKLNLPSRAMALLFLVLTAWMSVRFLYILGSPPVQPVLRAANPTTWKTVFGYIVIMSLMTVCVMWMEVARNNLRRDDQNIPSAFISMDVFRKKLFFLWSGIAVLIVGVVSVLGIGYVNLREVEKARMIRTSELVTDSFVEHTTQVVGQVDAILHAVRGYYQRTGSIDETARFIDSLNFNTSIIDNIYLIGSNGRIVISHNSAALGRSIADREYFDFHRTTREDQIFISPVLPGRVTGKYHFRITRRIDNQDGSFGGIVLATLNSESFSRYYSNITSGVQNITSLLSISDRKLRARVPNPSPDQWSQPVSSPIWDALKTSPIGSYENISPIDNIRRYFVYKKVGSLPLVIVTGFSNSDLNRYVNERTGWMVATLLAVFSITLLLALLLTSEAKRRDEQERFMSMLSHELKTPLSVIGLALGSERIQQNTRKHAQRAVNDMSAVIERCLQADSLTSGRYAAKLEAIRIEEIIEELCAASSAPARLAQHIAELPLCKSDRQSVRIILGNLIDNAIKYGDPDREICIEGASCMEYGKQTIIIRITNGIGSAGVPDDKSVFEKYYRGSKAHSKTGSGLGLYVSASLARLIHCQLRYLPSDEEVCFEFRIPI